LRVDVKAGIETAAARHEKNEVTAQRSTPAVPRSP
jgi:hypothetical protein